MVIPYRRVSVENKHSTGIGAWLNFRERRSRVYKEATGFRPGLRMTYVQGEYTYILAEE